MPERITAVRRQGRRKGRSNTGICERLALSPKTVEGHVRNIFMKLGVGESADDHRRVLAVLNYLRSRPQPV